VASHIYAIGSRLKNFCKEKQRV